MSVLSSFIKDERKISFLHKINHNAHVGFKKEVNTSFPNATNIDSLTVAYDVTLLEL